MVKSFTVEEKPGKMLKESSLWSPRRWGLAQGQALCARWKVLLMCSDIEQSSRKGRKSEIPGKEKKFNSQSLSGEKEAEQLAKN